jgi:hypothetical protein
MPVNRSTENEKYTAANNFGDDFDINARPAQTTSGAVLSGWGNAESITTPSNSYPAEFKHSDKTQVIKFIDPNGPFAIYKMHFLTNKPGKKSYVCLKPTGQDCPLCTLLNHKPEDKRAFTILNFSAEGGPQRQMLIATPPLFRTLVTANDSNQGPLVKIYWGLSRTGERASTTYHLTAIKPRDLEEDWGINETEASATVESTEVYTSEVIRETPYNELVEIAESLLGS